MEPINPLGTELHHAGERYELWLQRNEWFLYRGSSNERVSDFSLSSKPIGYRVRIKAANVIG